MIFGKSNLYKEISKTATELEIYIALEQKINEVEILKYSFLHFLLFLDLVCNLLPDNFVIYLFTFPSFLYDFHFSLLCTGEGNGNPLEYSCLENPRDRGAWWAAVYGVAQSRTQLK